MKKHEFIAKIKLIIDSRENNIYDFCKECQKYGIPYEIRKLNFGDYSFYFDLVTFENRIVIERKSGNPIEGGGFAEIKNNICSKNHSRFSAEFERAKNCKNLAVLLENCTDLSSMDLVKQYKVDGKRSTTLSTFKKAFDTFFQNRDSNRIFVGSDRIDFLFADEKNRLSIILMYFYKKILLTNY